MKSRIFTAVICIVCLIVTACTSVKNPSAVTDEFINAVKSQDFEKVKVLSSLGDVQNELTDKIQELLGDAVTGSDEDAAARLFMQKLFDFDYTIGEEKIEGDQATVEVTFKTFDFYEMLKSYFKEAFSKGLAMTFSGASGEELREYGETLLQEELEKLTEKNHETKAILALKKEENEWKVTQMKPDSEFLDAMFGGLFSLFNSFDDLS